MCKLSALVAVEGFFRNMNMRGRGTENRVGFKRGMSGRERGRVWILKTMIKEGWFLEAGRVCEG